MVILNRNVLGVIPIWWRAGICVRPQFLQMHIFGCCNFPFSLSDIRAVTKDLHNINFNSEQHQVCHQSYYRHDWSIKTPGVFYIPDVTLIPSSTNTHQQHKHTKSASISRSKLPSFSSLSTFLILLPVLLTISAASVSSTTVIARHEWQCRKWKKMVWQLKESLHTVYNLMYLSIFT